MTGRRANQLRHEALTFDFRQDPYEVIVRIRTPNGIRTRVAAVKGRSPRPLDDGSLLALASCASNREELYTGTTPKHNSKKRDASHGASFAQNSN